MIKRLISSTLFFLLLPGLVVADQSSALDLLEEVEINGKLAFQSCDKKGGNHQRDILKIKLQALISESKKSVVSGKERSTNTSYTKEIQSKSSGFVSGRWIQFRELDYLDQTYLCAYKFK